MIMTKNTTKNMLFVYLILIIFFVGCQSGKQTKQTQEDNNVQQKMSEEYINDYFPYKPNQKVSFGGRLLDYGVEGKIILKFHKEMDGKKGELWRVTMVDIEDAARSKEERKDVLSIRNSLYYFFVTRTRIYWIERKKLSSEKMKEICNQAQLPKDADVVCQNKRKVVNRDGWHYRIILEEKNFISYSAWYKVEQEASYLRNVTFKKGVGIVEFSSQATLAGAESIELWDERFYHSEEYAVINRY